MDSTHKETVQDSPSFPPIILAQPPAFEPQPAPGSAGPEPLPHRLFCIHHGAVARVWSLGESSRDAILNDPSFLNDQHPAECQDLAHVMGDAQ